MVIHAVRHLEVPDEMLLPLEQKDDIRWMVEHDLKVRRLLAEAYNPHLERFAETGSHVTRRRAPYGFGPALHFQYVL
jgi:hypothetical protein